MKKILLLQGAHLCYLGKREPEIYGTMRAKELDERLYAHDKAHISSIAKRNIHSVLADLLRVLSWGFGIHSYILALDAMLEILKEKK